MRSGQPEVDAGLGFLAAGGSTPAQGVPHGEGLSTTFAGRSGCRIKGAVCVVLAGVQIATVKARLFLEHPPALATKSMQLVFYNIPLLPGEYSTKMLCNLIPSVTKAMKSVICSETRATN